MGFLRRAAAFGAGVGLVCGCIASAFCLPWRNYLAAAALALQSPAAACAAVPHPTPAATPAPIPQMQIPVPTSAAALPSPMPVAPTPTETPAPAAPPLTDAGRIRAEQFPQGSGNGYIALESGTLRNLTQNADSDLRAAVSTENLPFAIERNSTEPQILILHTHATETYQTWPDLIYDRAFTARTTNTALNMCAIGSVMTDVLNKAGICTLHDTTLHDAAGYTESYARSHTTAQAYLEKYPSIKIILDVHRDAIEDSDGTRVKPLCQIDGEDTAQVMLIAGCDNGSSISLPNWRLNLRFAAAWEQAMETVYPGLTRPAQCSYRYYNQDLTTGSLLIEIGGHANTLTEAKRAARYAAQALAQLLVA